MCDWTDKYSYYREVVSVLILKRKVHASKFLVKFPNFISKTFTSKKKKLLSVKTLLFLVFFGKLYETKWFKTRGNKSKATQ